jgi:putative flippase GtrA
MKFLNSNITRFIIGGTLNTSLTYLLYLFFLSLFHYLLAFTLTFLAGFFLAYCINSFFVFKIPLTLNKLFQYPFLILFQYFFGALLMIIIVDYFDVDRKFAPIFYLIVMTPISYFGNRFLLIGFKND